MPRVNLRQSRRGNLHLPFRSGERRRPRALACRFVRGFDHITNAPYRLDQLLRIAVVDLAAQVPDVHVDYVSQAVVIHVPDMLDDHRAAERASHGLLGGLVGGLIGGLAFAWFAGPHFTVEMKMIQPQTDFPAELSTPDQQPQVAMRLVNQVSANRMWLVAGVETAVLILVAAVRILRGPG